MKVVVVRTGTANLAAVLAALGRQGVEVHLSADPAEVAGAERVILPGVGAFKAALSALQEAELEEAIRGRVTGGEPTMGICLGLHLLAEGSEESPGSVGLGCIPGVASEFPPSDLRVPQMGWNSVRPDEGCSVVPEGFAYYANSFRLTVAPPGWDVAWTEYGTPFIAAIERGPVVACQFHPELSGSYGRTLLGRWLEESRC